MWRLFIDDERFPVGDDWEIARNMSEVKNLILEKGSFPKFISFDHDLGDNEPTGFDITKMLIEMHLDGDGKFPNEFDYYVHSQNPIGKKNIESMIDNFLNFLESHR
jgi:hypothetical protein